MSKSQKYNLSKLLYYGVIRITKQKHNNFISVMEEYGKFVIKSIENIQGKELSGEWNSNHSNPKLYITHTENKEYSYGHIGLDAIHLFEAINVIDRNSFKNINYNQKIDIQFSDDIISKCSNIIYLSYDDKLPKFYNNDLKNFYHFNKFNKYDSEFTEYHINILKNLFKIPFKINQHAFIILLLILNKKFGDDVFNFFCQKYFINLDVTIEEINRIEKQIKNVSKEDKIKHNVTVELLEKKREDLIRELNNTNELKHALLLSYIYLYSSSFYLPVYYDFRGRVYCNSSYLNYQKNEIIRSLIMFRDSCIINDLYEFKKHCVKTYLGIYELFIKFSVVDIRKAIGLTYLYFESKFSGRDFFINSSPVFKIVF